jgi:Ran GTPase-activating protein (RanGAP) involved in mRNA processing and transport
MANALNNNKTLVWLSLSSNRIGDIGIQALAKTLATNNSHLNTITPHGNGITDRGAEYLAKMLKTNKT